MAHTAHEHKQLVSSQVEWVVATRKEWTKCTSERRSNCRGKRRRIIARLTRWVMSNPMTRVGDLSPHQSRSRSQSQSQIWICFWKRLSQCGDQKARTNWGPEELDVAFPYLLPLQHQKAWVINQLKPTHPSPASEDGHPILLMGFRTWRWWAHKASMMEDFEGIQIEENEWRHGMYSLSLLPHATFRGRTT